jgi:MFS family permease
MRDDAQRTTGALGRPRLPRWEMAIVFSLNALVLSSWFLYVAPTASALHLTAYEVGLSLVGLDVGLLIGAIASYPLTHWLGLRRAIVIGVIVDCAGMALPGLAGNHVQLAAALLVSGFGNGVLDPVQHSEINRHEHELGRSQLGYYTSLYSGAQVFSALIAPVAIQFGVPPEVYLGGVASAGLIAAVVASAGLLRADPLPEAAAEALPRRADWRFRRWAVAMACVATAGFLLEGIWSDWHGLFLQSIGAAPALAAVGYTLFQIASASCRLVQGWLVERWGRFRVLIGFAGVSLGGALLVITATRPVVGLIGALLLGCGSVAVVIAISAAGRRTGLISFMTGVGYTALIAGPVITGFLAAAIGLRLALISLVVCAGVFLTLGAAVKTPEGPATP